MANTELKAELKRLGDMLLELEMTARLCDPPGREIVEEFGFRGDKEKVREQLVALIDRYAKHGIPESEKPFLEENARRMSEWKEKEKNIRKIYAEKMKNAVKEGDFALLTEVQHAYQKRRDEMHERGECICSTNVMEGE